MVDRFEKQGGSLCNSEVTLTHLNVLPKRDRERDRKEKGVCTDYERFSLDQIDSLLLHELHNQM